MRNTLRKMIAYLFYRKGHVCRVRLLTNGKYIVEHKFFFGLFWTSTDYETYGEDVYDIVYKNYFTALRAIIDHKKSFYEKMDTFNCNPKYFY